jgi:hypothetical protein
MEIENTISMTYHNNIMIVNKNIQVVFDQLNEIQSELYQSKFRTL